jgi:thiamine biosynthesis lipoprotein
MVIRQTWFGGLAVAMALLVGCASPQPAGNAGEGAEGPPALWSLDGKSVPWANVRMEGRRNVVVFMTPFCRACHEEQPHVEAFAREHERDTQVFYVIAGSDAESAAELAEKRAIQVTVYADPEGRFSDYYAVERTPTVLVFDAAGKLTGTHASIDDLGEDSRAEKLKPISDSGREIGTSYDVVVMAADEQQARRDLASAREVVHEAERHLSEWNPESDLSKLNRGAAQNAVEAKGDLLRLITASRKVSDATYGAFDITWLPLGAVWQEARRSRVLPTEEKIRSTLEAVGPDKVAVDGSMVRFTHPDTKIGLGAVAKGWIVDAVFLHLRKRGYENLIVNIGGDLRTAGVGPDGAWTFQIKDPYNPDSVIGTFELQDGSVATSGNYARYVEIDGKRYGHILDPRTGWPAPFDGSVSVLTPDCAMADALSTALFVIGPEEGMKWAGKNPGVRVIYATREGLISNLD